MKYTTIIAVLALCLVMQSAQATPEQQLDEHSTGRMLENRELAWTVSGGAYGHPHSTDEVTEWIDSTLQRLCWDPRIRQHWGFSTGEACEAAEDVATLKTLCLAKYQTDFTEAATDDGDIFNAYQTTQAISTTDGSISQYEWHYDNIQSPSTDMTAPERCIFNQVGLGLAGDLSWTIEIWAREVCDSWWWTTRGFTVDDAQGWAACLESTTFTTVVSSCANWYSAITDTVDPDVAETGTATENKADDAWTWPTSAVDETIHNVADNAVWDCIDTILSYDGGSRTADIPDDDTSLVIFTSVDAPAGLLSPVEAFTFLCETDELWWRWGDNPCTQFAHDPEQAYTNGEWTGCDTTYLVDTSENAWPRWGFWYAEDADPSDDENETEALNGDLREDVWDLCLNDNLADDWQTNGPRVATAADEANDFWQAEYWDELFEYMTFLSYQRWYQFANLPRADYEATGHIWHIFDVCFPQARAVSDPSADFKGDQVFAQGNLHTNTEDTDGVAAARVAAFMLEYKKCTKEFYVEYIADGWGNNKANDELTLADATTRICAYDPVRFGMTQAECNAYGKTYLDAACADWKTATVADEETDPTATYDYYAAFGINTVWDCLSQYEPMGVPQYTVEQATTAATAYCVSWREHSFDSQEACTAASPHMIEHCAAGPIYHNHAEWTDEFTADPTLAATACFDELVSVTMLREHEITQDATNMLCMFDWKMFGFESAEQCWENWNNLYDACGYHNHYYYWMVQKYGLTNAVMMMAGKDYMTGFWSDAFDEPDLEPEAEGDEDPSTNDHTEANQGGNQGLEGIHSHDGPMSDQVWNNMLYMGNDHHHSHPTAEQRMAGLCLHGLYNKHLELWNFYISDLDWLCQSISGNWGVPSATCWAQYETIYDHCSMWPMMFDTVHECFNDAIINNAVMTPSSAAPVADDSSADAADADSSDDATTVAASSPSAYVSTDQKFWPPRYSKQFVPGTPLTMDGMTNWYLMNGATHCLGFGCCKDNQAEAMNIVFELDWKTEHPDDNFFDAAATNAFTLAMALVSILIQGRN